MLGIRSYSATLDRTDLEEFTVLIPDFDVLLHVVFECSARGEFNLAMLTFKHTILFLLVFSHVSL